MQARGRQLQCFGRLQQPLQGAIELHQDSFVRKLRRLCHIACRSPDTSVSSRQTDSQAVILQMVEDPVVQA